MKIAIFTTLCLLLGSCGVDESNRRGYVISKTNELTPEDPIDMNQP